MREFVGHTRLRRNNADGFGGAWAHLLCGAFVGAVSVAATGCYEGLTSTAAGALPEDDGAAHSGGDDTQVDEDTGGDGSDGGDPAPAASEEPGLVRLRLDEYRRSVQRLLALDEPPTVDGIQPTMGAHGFRVSSPVALVDARALENAAHTAATDYVAASAPCGESPTLDCLHEHIAHLSEAAYRRPPTLQEHDALAAHIDARWDEGMAPDEIFVEVISRILQGPQMQYLDLQGDSPDETGRRVLNSHELASRLSFALWGAPPDDELLGVANADGLATPEQVRAQAERMLQTADAQRMIGTFVEEWLLLFLAENVFPDAERYPAFSQALAERMVEESRRFAAHSVTAGEGTLRSLLTAEFSVIDADLATLYGVEAPDVDWSVVALPPERSGVLTQPAFLAATAGSQWGDPIHRGVLLNERVLCNAIPAPDGIDTQVELPEELEDPRDAYPQHELAACRGCHEMINLAGFAFERFDALGQYRASRPEFEGEIDASGSLIVDGTTVDFGDAAEAIEIIADSESAQHCMSKYLFRFLVRRTEVAADQLSSMQDRFTASDGALLPFIVDVVASPSFTSRSSGEGDA